MKHLLNITLLSFLALSSGYAQDFELDDDYVNSDQMDIDGDFQRKVDYSKKRRKFENKTNNLIDKKIEDIRLKHERALQKDLSGMFSGQPQQDVVQTKQAAPKKEVVEKIVVKTLPPKVEPKRVHITPYVGYTQTQSDLEDSFSSSLSLGATFDVLLSNYVSLGLSLGYSKTDLTVEGGQGPIYAQNGFGYYNTNNFIVPETEIDFTRLNIELMSRVFLMNHHVFRPYFVLGLGLARNKLEYDEKSGSSFSNTPTNFYQRDSEYTDNSFYGGIGIGGDIYFNDTVGLNIQAKFTQTLGSSDSSKSSSINYYETRDESLLRRVNDIIEDSSYMVLSAGVVVKF